MAEQIEFEFAIYYASTPAKEPLGELETQLKNEFSSLRRVEKIEGRQQAPVIAARIEKDVPHNYAPPDLESLRYFGRGLSREQALALQDTQQAMILDFSHSKEHVWTGLRSATQLVHVLARDTEGLIWDETTREVFTPVEWERRRLTDWDERVPDITSHIVIHAYKKDEFVRAITLGMAKAGLPDVVADSFSWSLNRNMGHLVNLFAQAMAEGAAPPKPGEIDLDIRAIKNPRVREPQVTTLKPNATGIALLTLTKGNWEEGDPENRLIELGFDRGSGPDIHAKQEQIVGAAFGWEDSITRIKHDEGIKAASAAARKKLPVLRVEFNQGLAPGEFIQVKAPFATPGGGNEWMWVEVTTWNGDAITGLLKNEPFDIPDLHAGQIVKVSESRVFDYIRKHADGTVEGNETGELIEKQSP
jgi:uncharacterized protein YegJ (DUF2314 family)